MAEFYVDHGAYGTGLGTGSAPTWGVPQDGDGTTKDAATAAGIGSVLFGSVPTSGAVSVFGASVSTTGVLSAASVDAAANALATNINATTAVITSGFGTDVGNSGQLRNFVYARGPAGGAPAGTCQIMCRYGSTALNVTGIASTLNGAPTLTQFTGGTSGCFGYLGYPGVAGVSGSIAQYSFGVFHVKPTVCKSGSASNYVLTATDVLWCRSGTGRTITYPAISTTTGCGRQAAQGPLNLVVDTNVKWTGDSGTGIVKIEMNMANGGYSDIALMGTQVSQLSISALAKSGFQIGFTGANFGYFPQLAIGGHSTTSVRLHNVRLFDESTSSSFVPFRFPGSGAVTLDDCVMSWTAARSGSLSGQPMLFPGATVGSGWYNSTVFTNVSVDFNYTGVTPPPVIGTVAPAELVDFRWLGGVCSGSSTPFPLFFGYTGSAPKGSRIIIDGVSGYAFPAAYLGWQRALDGSSTNGEDDRVVQLRYGGAGRSFRYEDQAAIYDWDSAASPALPYLSALHPDATPYSIRMLWFDSAAMEAVRGARLPAFGVFNRTSGVTSAKVEMLIPTALTLTPMSILVTATYEDASGVPRSDSITSASLASSSATWTNAGSFSGHAAKKLTVPLSYAPAVNSEVQIRVVVYGRPSTASNQYLFFDPAVVLA